MIMHPDTPMNDATDHPNKTGGLSHELLFDRTKWALQQLILYFQVQEMRVFIDGGFDNTFEVVSCTLEEMFEELKRQMWETGDFDGLPKFYQIRIP